MPDVHGAGKDRGVKVAVSVVTMWPGGRKGTVAMVITNRTLPSNLDRNTPLLPIAWKPLYTNVQLILDVNTGKPPVGTT